MGIKIWSKPQLAPCPSRGLGVTGVKSSSGARTAENRATDIKTAVMDITVIVPTGRSGGPLQTAVGHRPKTLTLNLRHRERVTGRGIQEKHRKSGEA